MYNGVIRFNRCEWLIYLVLEIEKSNIMWIFYELLYMQFLEISKV